MKFKKITVKSYRYWTMRDGVEVVFDAKDVTILVDENSAVTPETFDRDKDEYYISSEEVERIENLNRFISLFNKR